MTLRAENSEGTIHEYIHYEPSKKDLIEFYGKVVDYETWDIDKDFEDFLTEKYETDLTYAMQDGYNDLNDYLEDLRW